MEKLLERFLKYVKTESQSDESCAKSPSTKNQFKFAKQLVKELKSIGIKNARVDKNGYVMASLASNIDKPAPVIGFISHMDTSPDMSGANVKPQIIKNYDGSNIVLNDKKNIVLSPEEFPELKNYINNTIITTDGTTLLGADDKAGIAEIMTAVEYLVNNPHIKHGEIKIAFTPDEEISRGADLLNIKEFNADFAYTIDGGEIGELEYENFNAAKATITINGQNVHPGYAKDKMINSMIVAMEFNKMLPENARPELTEKYEGFFHIIDIIGNVENTIVKYIIRDHDKSNFESKKKLLHDNAKVINDKYGKEIVAVEVTNQYFNMKEKIEPKIEIVELAKKAMTAVGVKPNVKPIRGGTDGSNLSFKGLPTPNIFAGGHNFHGKFEFVPLESMQKAVDVILKIVELGCE